jgi:hypothetical protein
MARADRLLTLAARRNQKFFLEDVAMANALEDAICSGIIDAQKKYYEMTGHLLRHAPEAFLSTLIAMKIHEKLRCSVYMDAALSRIAREREESGILSGERPKPEDLSLRPDISVWGKTTGRIRAAIEVKRAPWTAGISKDVERLRRLVGKDYGPKAGYVVSHTVSDKENTVNARIDHWINNNSTLIRREIKSGRDGRFWGYALLKVKPLG